MDTTLAVILSAIIEIDLTDVDVTRDRANGCHAERRVVKTAFAILRVDSTFRVSQAVYVSNLIGFEIEHLVALDRAVTGRNDDG